MELEEIIFFKAKLEGTEQEYEGRIEESSIYISGKLIGVLDDDEYCQSVRQQLEAILLLHGYSLEKICQPREIC